MKPFKKPLGLPLAVAAIAILFLVAAACGGGDNNGEQPESSPVSQQNESDAAIPTATPIVESESTVAPSARSTETNQDEAPVQSSSNVAQSTETPEPVATPESGARESQGETVDTSEPTATEEPTSLPTPQAETGTVGGEVGNRAPKFAGIANWINSPALSMQELRGQVVLIDFWTYTCVNCIRTFPHLREWQAKYADKGLVIVGVHAPEFEFEKITDNVVRSAQEYDLSWAIAQDNDFGTWRAYSNRFWPAKYLVDQEGVVRYTHFGEGSYIATEEQIRSLLLEAGADLSAVAVSEDPAPKVDPRAYTQDPQTRITREIYGGYGRNASPQGVYVSHPMYYDGPNRTVFYTDPGVHNNQFIYLQGPWLNGPEQLRHARQTQNYEDYLALKFAATSVNAVIDPEGGEPFEVQVTIDGRPLLLEEGGVDLVVEDGRSFFRVDEARMYEVVALPEFGSHELTLSSNSPDFSFFAFTFGAYEEGP